MLLYKYIDKNILNVLKNESLKFSSRNDLNDPFELYPYFEPIETEKPELLNEPDDKEYLVNLLKYIPKEVLDTMPKAEWLALLRNTRNMKNPYKIKNPKNWIKGYFRDLVPNLLRILNDTFGILSLSENPLNIPMWAHYSDNNKGFAIGFDTKNEYFFEKHNRELDYRNLRKVNYSTDRPTIKDIYNPDEIFDTFFNKSTHWSYENEWRVCRRLEDADDIIQNDGKKLHLFKFNPNIIKEIYFGLRSELKIRDEIIQIVRSNSKFKDIKFFDIELDEKEFRLIPKLIEI